jgi:predicted AlkP superfamily phosphohydrolase/phosphomutase
MSGPLLVIGLDGASFDALDRLRAAGTMPTLDRLVHEGATCELASVVPPITPVAWTSFLTGKTPAKHGIFDFRVYDPRAGVDAFVSGNDVRDTMFPELFVRAGRTVAVVSLPMTYPPRASMGSVVSGFETPSTSSPFTNPHELRTEILRRFPDYVFLPEGDVDDPDLATEAAFEAFVATAERGMEQRTWIATTLMARAAHDLMIVHFQETDALQHKLWRHLVDPAASPARAERTRGAYRHLDACLARLIGAMPPATTVLVVSDHGFGPHVGRVYPNVLLHEWGELGSRGRRTARFRRSMRRWRRALGIGAPDARRRRWLEDARDVTFGSLPIDWRRTRAYVGVAEVYAGLFVNRRGREPGGIVADADVAPMLASLRERFLAVRDPRTGSPVFDDAVAGSELYPEDRCGRRPDLFLVPAGGFSLGRALGSRRWLERYRTDVSGTHRMQGVLIAAGPGIRAAPTRGAASITDLAPTLLAAADVPIPADMDGRVLDDLFRDVPVARFTDADPPRALASRSAVEDEDALTRRLRGLGYLG